MLSCADNELDNEYYFRDQIIKIIDTSSLVVVVAAVTSHMTNHGLF